MNGNLHFMGCDCAACGQRTDWQDTAGTATTTSTANTAYGSLQELADFIREDYWGAQRQYNLGTTGPFANNGVLTFNVTGFSNKLGLSDANGISAARAELVRESFKIYGEVLGIQFVETTSSNADFFFSDNQSGAFASSTGYLQGIEYTVVNVESNWSGGSSSYDDYTLQTFLHEIGHGLGLGHQGFYNGSASFADADFANDSWALSMMSYFSQGQNPNTSAWTEFLQTPMAVDWIALNDIYAPQTGGIANAFAGDTVYGVGTNISSTVSDIWAQFANYAGRTAYTIVDGGGVDLLDVSNFAAAQLIDLTVTRANDIAATAMNIGGSVGNLSLAAGTVIENARGGSGDDVFIGNAADNRFWGMGGNDSFTDSAGADVYDGGAGEDSVSFAGASATYSFEIAGTALRVVNGVVDLVQNTVEWLDFADVTLSFSDIWSDLTTPDPDPDPDPEPEPGTVLSLAGLVSYGGQQDKGSATVSPDGTTAELTGNAWKTLLEDVTVTADTILRFDFSSDVEGEIHGIGFDTDSALSQDRTFQLHGTQTWGIQAFNDSYTTGSGVQSYEIRVGDYFTGDFDRITFVMDDDKYVGGNSVFSNVELVSGTVNEPEPDPDPSGIVPIGTVSSHGGKQDKGTYTLSPDALSITLENNAWKSIARDVTVTENTVLKFTFSSDVEGEIHGIGLDRDGDLSKAYMFQLDGTQEWGRQDFAGDYVSGSGPRDYEIAIGQYYQGDFDRIVLAMDDDWNVGADSTFSNIRFEEVTTASAMADAGADQFDFWF